MEDFKILPKFKHLLGLGWNTNVYILLEILLL